MFSHAGGQGEKCEIKGIFGCPSQPLRGHVTLAHLHPYYSAEVVLFLFDALSLRSNLLILLAMALTLDKDNGELFLLP